MLHIYLFGNPQILNNHASVPRPIPNKVFTLLAYLLLKGRRPIPRNHLAYLFWPNASESEARANLRRHLHLLRKQLPAPPQDIPWILSVRQTLQWNPQANYWLDVAELETFNPETAEKAQWKALFNLYSGDLLEGFYDDWILAERVRLQRHYIQLLEARIADQKQRSNAPNAIQAARQLLHVDPQREEAYRQLMELYYHAGDRAAALREFEKCRAMLQSQLNVNPMPQTLALRDAILKGDRQTPVPGVSDLANPEPNNTDLKSALLQADRLKASASPLPASSSVWRKRANWIAAAIVLALLLLTLAIWNTGFFLPNPAPVLHTLTLSGPQVTQDTWIDKDNPNLPYDPLDPEKTLKADYQQVHLMFWGFPYDRVLIRFDLEQLPPEAAIEKAVFYQRLDVYTNEDLTEPRPATISAFKILRPWQAKSATYNTPWSRPGLAADVDYDSQPLGSQAFHGETWFKVDITPLALDWAARPEENFGLMLMLTEAPRGAHYWVDTSNHPLGDHRPRLELIYTLKN